ncbi:MAG TPA: alpha-L-rhamnosidase N-terminal domain-containing protein [Puia sp.]|jgi:hypothetical protein
MTFLRILFLLFLYPGLATESIMAQTNNHQKTTWNGKWIWLDSHQFPDRQRTNSPWINGPWPGQHPYRALFRKNFNLDQLPLHAILFMTADVRYRVYINGFPVAEGPPNPGGDYGDTTSPSYWYYSSFDVQDKLKRGRNTISVEVFAWALELSDITSSFGRLIAELQDGKKDLVVTDTSWKAIADTSYSYADNFLQYDARKEDSGWKTNAFPDDQWPHAALQHRADSTRLYQSNIPGCTQYPVKPSRLFKPKLHASQYILDFNRNIVAHISLVATANTGDSIELLAYEKMGAGAMPSRKFRYFCQKGLNTFRTPAVSPFRYLLVKVHTQNGLTIQKVNADFTTYPVQYRGSFLCSDSFYNRLWSIVRYTTQLCMSDLFFDSPMHQEPIGCTGDYFIESMNNYYAFGDRWLARQNLVQTAQMMEKNNYKMFHTSYSLIWVQMLRQYVQFTGDTSILQELLPHAYRLMDRFKSYLDKDGLVSAAPNYMFMDWITIKGYNAHHPPAMIGMGYMSALLYKAMKDIDDMRVIAGIGHPLYTAIGDSIRKGINTVLWDPARKLYRDGIPFTTKVAPNDWMPADSNVITYSPHVNTLAVLYDIAPEDSREAIMDYVATQHEYELQPYFMFYVLDAAQKAGWQDRGLEMIDRWRGGIDTSTYTLKENWRDKTDFGYSGDYSHAWGGAPLRWLSVNVLGISPGTPGFSSVSIHPYCGERLKWAKGWVPVGEKASVYVSWKKQHDGFSFTYTIPSGRIARFYIPGALEKNKWFVDGRKFTGGGPLSLAAGKHVIRCIHQLSKGD